MGYRQANQMTVILPLLRPLTKLANEPFTGKCIQWEPRAEVGQPICTDLQGVMRLEEEFTKLECLDV